MANAQAGQNQASGKKPNIVFILVDNLGYGELGVYGGGILRGASTPRIDKLAGEGRRHWQTLFWMRTTCEQLMPNMVLNGHMR
jgi:hypothetical protein